MRQHLYHRTYESQQLKKTRRDRDTIKHLLGYFKPYRFLMFLAILFLIIAKGIEAYVPFYIGRITHVILNSFSLDLSERLTVLSSIVRQCFGIMGLLFIAYCLDTATVFLKNLVGQKALFALRTHVYRHIQKMPLEYYNTHSIGSLMTRTIHDIDQLHHMFAESIIPLIGSILLFLCICVALIIMDWRVALVLGGIFPAVIFLTHHFRIHQRRCYDKIRSIVSAMNSYVQEHLMGISTIRSFGLQKQERQHFDELNEDHCTANIEAIHYFSFFFAGIDLVQSVSLIAIFATLVAITPSATEFDAGTFFAFSLYVLMLFRPLADLAERYNVLQSAMAAADRIFHVLDQPQENPGPSKGPPLQEITSIAFNDVWFAYKENNWILKGLTFSIKKGESVALVGITGAGKSTIMNLLLRYYDYQKGSITINGHDIRAFPVATIRRQFSVILQDPEIFSGTIAENIRLDDPAITDERIEEVAAYVNVKPLIKRFSDGWEHLLPERGKSLSVGERQLLSMARAIAHNRSLFLLDEATANIDSATEKIIQETLQKMLHEKTGIIIAHRLSTIQGASKIIVLHQGIASEIGTHRELLKKKGIYEKLYRLQFS